MEKYRQGNSPTAYLTSGRRSGARCGSTGPTGAGSRRWTGSGLWSRGAAPPASSSTHDRDARWSSGRGRGAAVCSYRWTSSRSPRAMVATAWSSTSPLASLRRGRPRVTIGTRLPITEGQAGL